jgi:hypothetical protein
MNRARTLRLAIGLVAVFVLIQVIRPSRTNPAVVPSRSVAAHMDMPQDVQAVLKRACYDCHSSDTVWPWYSQVAPVSWYIAHDVKVARRHINFEDWEAQVSPSEGREHLGLACKLMREGKMPPEDYLFMHKNASVSTADVNSVCAWTQKVAPPENEGDEGHHDHDHHDHDDKD